MIRSFKDGDTEKVWNLTYVKRFSNDIAKKAREEMQIIDAAGSINDLRIPPGNRPEKLKGARADQHSIRINDQWRICFIWNDGAGAVEICDHH